VSETTGRPPVKTIKTPMRLEYQYTAGVATSRFLRGIGQGRILGQRCPSCKKVYVPPRGSCPRCAVATEEEVQVSDRGTITTFAIVRVPSENIDVPLPFASVHVLLDGTDIPFFSVVQECPLEEVRIGMRVQAAWVPKAELAPTLQSIKWFKPSGEPDVPFEQLREHL
jgi:uncharacterized OB-fold protein